MGAQQKTEGNWRTRMGAVLEQLNTAGTGLLISVDEVTADLPEMIELASVYQHFVGEDRKVSLIMAGLPSKVSALLRSDFVSFLRRACRHDLRRIADADISEALVITVQSEGRTIDVASLGEAVEAIGGSPYMFQLLGYRMWNQNPGEEIISEQDTKAAIPIAQADFRERVLDATYFDLSEGDIKFLIALLSDAEESRLSDIATRLGESSGYVSTYKRRLMEQGIIRELGRGVVAFDLPGFREYFEDRIGFGI